MGMLGTTDEVDDVAQEVFVRFYKALGNFRSESSLGTYLGRIAINTTLNAIDKRKKRRWLSWGQEDKLATWEPVDRHTNPDRAELQDLLRQALAKLSPDYRAVVVLRLIEGYSVAETAQVLDIPQGTVASRLARAQQQLQQWLKPVLK